MSRLDDIKNGIFSWVSTDYDHCRTAADFVQSKMHIKPVLGIILGSGLGPLADDIEVDSIVSYADIPGFPLSTVSSHIGRFIIGKLGGVDVICMQGRVHYYEGYDFSSLAMSVRVMGLLGIRCLIVTNAAGAVNIAYKPGDIMLISDHINMMGLNPVIGQNYSDFGERFYDVSNLYNKKLRQLAKKCAKRSELDVHEGVYMFYPGPNFETPAEIRAFRLLGADATGMSTVPETLTAAHMGITVLGFSVMTNMAAGVLNQPLTDEEVCETSKKISSEFSAYMKDVVAAMKEEYEPKDWKFD